MLGWIRGGIHRLLYERLWARQVDAVRARGFVTFTFDDFPASALDIGGAILEKYDCRGTYYASPGLMGCETVVGRHFSLRDLERAAAKSHEIASHSSHGNRQLQIRPCPK